MILIFVKTELLEEAKKTVFLETGLQELVKLSDQPQDADKAVLVVDDQTIHLSIGWRQSIPPYLITDHLPYNQPNLLGLIFLQLGAYEKAAYYLQDYQQIMKDLMIAEQLQQGNTSSLQNQLTAERHKLSDFDHYRRLHNQAVLLHYQGHQQELSLDFVIKTYGEALAAAPDDEYFAFTTRQLSDLYLDMGYLNEAEEVVRQAWQRKLSEQAHYALQSGLIQILLRKLQPPYPKIQLAEITVLLKESLTYYENSGQHLELGMLSMDAAWVAQLKDNFSEGLACINQAIRLFEQEEVPELQGDAWMRKGTLLYGWAQKGQPFHQQAIDSYQKALKIFSREVAPYVYADIHHHLALIYSEMPAPKEKKAMLYAIASKSFQEALGYFTKEHFPYEYGCVCNNYGNALVKFPDSNFQNTTQKAVAYFEEALSVRHSKHYPYERATSLLNLLEAYWQLPLDTQNREVNQRRWGTMKELAQEAKTLLAGHDSVLREQAEQHLTELEKARNSYA
jgi:tetratricopeptide (TPR) repeat protein